MYWRVYLDTVNDTIFEGTKEECEMIYDVFLKYNNAKNIKLEEL